MAKKLVKKNSNPERSNYGLISYLLGIVAIVEAVISPLAGLVLGIIGLSFAVKDPTSSSKRAKTLNILAIVIGAVLLLLVLILSVSMGDYLSQ